MGQSRSVKWWAMPAGAVVAMARRTAFVKELSASFMIIFRKMFQARLQRMLRKIMRYILIFRSEDH